MRGHIWRTALLAVVTSGILSAGHARAAVIQEWTFDTNFSGSVSGTTFTPLSPETPPPSGTVTFTGVHANSAAYSNPVGNGSAKSESANTWSLGDYWQFNAAGVAGLEVQYDQFSSATGPASFGLFYSTDNGATFTDFSDYTVPSSPSWTSLSNQSGFTHLIDFTGVSAVETASNVIFRIQDKSATGSTAGTDRVDSVIVGTNLPEPATLGLIALGVVMTMARIRRSRAV